MTAYSTNLATVQTVLVNSSGGLEKLYAVDRVVAELKGAGVLDVLIQSATPSTTIGNADTLKLWLDTTASPGTLKYFSGSAWVAVSAPAHLYKHLRNNGSNVYAATAAPTTGDDFGDGYAVGSIWHDTTNDKIYTCIDATVGAAIWIDIGKQGDFKADGSVAMTGNLNLNGNDLLLDTDGNTKLNVTADNAFQIEVGGTNVMQFTTAGSTVPSGASISMVDAPTTANQLTNKSYVDGLVNGLSWVSTSAVVATTAAGTLATSFAAGQVVDGYTLVVGDTILIKNQASGVENGIYTVTAGAPTRSASLLNGAAAANKAIFVQRGTTNADKAFTCTNDSGSDVTGTDALVWGQFASATATPTFLTIQTPAGTHPVADVASDTLELKSTSSSITITGDATADSVSYDLNLTNANSWTALQTFASSKHTTTDIDAGTIDGTVIGGTTPAAASFTTLNATGGGSLTGTWTSLGTVTTIDLNGGTIDGTVIGATTPAAGSFTAVVGTTATFSSTGQFDDQVKITGDGAAGGALILNNAADTFAVTLQPPAALAANYTLTLPADDGTANQVLTTDGSGVLTWTTTSSLAFTTIQGTDASTTTADTASDTLAIASTNGSIVASAADAGTDTLNVQVTIAGLASTAASAAGADLLMISQGGTVKQIALSNMIVQAAIV